MKFKQLFFLLPFFILSCHEKQGEISEVEINPNVLNVFDNGDINKVIQNILDHNKNYSESSLILINETKFIGSELKKDSLILNENYFGNLKIELDSLITPEDWKFIKEQIVDNKKYIIDGNFFKQKKLNSDSLKNENLKFSNNQNRIIDSLKKNDFEKAKIYLAEKSYSEYHNYLQNATPILNIDKPLFTKDKKRVIFSFSTYSDPLNAFSEIAIYEFKKSKWSKIKMLRQIIS